jgi:hypothetical protein
LILDAVRRAPLPLAGTLGSLTVLNDDVKHFIESIDRDEPGGLRGLVVRVGGLYELAPIELDLSFLRALAALERLDMNTGTRHRRPDAMSARAGHVLALRPSRSFAVAVAAL